MYMKLCCYRECKVKFKGNGTELNTGIFDLKLSSSVFRLEVMKYAGEDFVLTITH